MWNYRRHAPASEGNNIAVWNMFQYTKTTNRDTVWYRHFSHEGPLLTGLFFPFYFYLFFLFRPIFLFSQSHEENHIEGNRIKKWNRIQELWRQIYHTLIVSEISEAREEKRRREKRTKQWRRNSVDVVDDGSTKACTGIGGEKWTSRTWGNSTWNKDTQHLWIIYFTPASPTLTPLRVTKAAVSSRAL